MAALLVWSGVRKGEVREMIPNRQAGDREQRGGMRWWAPLAAAVLAIGAAEVATAGPVYFIVAEREPFHHDSYVLPLTEPADIAHARDLIARGPPLVFAEVVPGATGSTATCWRRESRSGTGT